MANTIQVLGVVSQSDIPPQVRHGGKDGGRTRYKGLVSSLLLKLQELPPGQALRIQHSYPSGQVLSARIHMAAKERRLRVVVRVRGSEAYLWLAQDAALRE
jgi:hypothetical protein